MVLRPGEGGYVKALAEWDLQQHPDHVDAVSTVHGREEAMAVVHAVAENREQVAEAVDALDDPEASAEALRHVLVGGTPSVQAFSAEVAEGGGRRRARTAHGDEDHRRGAGRDRLAARLTGRQRRDRRPGHCHPTAAARLASPTVPCMAQIGMTDEVRELRARMKTFIDDAVIKAEPELERLAEDDLHPVTGLPMELYRAAEERGLDTSHGVPGPGDSATRRNDGPIADLQAEAKAAACGRSGTPPRSAAAGCRSWTSCYLNEIIGRSRVRPDGGRHGVACRTRSCSHLYASAEQRERWLRAAGRRRDLPVGRPDRARGRRLATRP